MFVLWSVVGISAFLLIFNPIRSCFLTHYSHRAVVILSGMGAKLFLFPSEWWPLSKLVERCPALASWFKQQSIHKWMVASSEDSCATSLGWKNNHRSTNHSHGYRLGMCVLYVCSGHSRVHVCSCVHESVCVCISCELLWGVKKDQEPVMNHRLNYFPSLESPWINVSLKGGCLMAVVKAKVGKHIKVLKWKQSVFWVWEKRRERRERLMCMFLVAYRHGRV